MWLFKVQVLVSSHGVSAGWQHAREPAAAQCITWHQLFQQSFKSFINLPHTKRCCMNTRLTDTQERHTVSILLGLLSENLYCISTSDKTADHWPSRKPEKNAASQNQMHNQILYEDTAPWFHLVWLNSRGQHNHTHTMCQSNSRIQSLHFIHNFTGEENRAFCRILLFTWMMSVMAFPTESWLRYFLIGDERIVVFCKDNLSSGLGLICLTFLVTYHEPFQQN